MNFTLIAPTCQWHQSHYVQKNLDPNLVNLGRVIGEDAENYVDYYNKLL